jgi:hypothetical protein
VSRGATKTARGQKPEEIQLVKTGSVYALPVTVNELLTLHFVLDSGAADVQIPIDTFDTLYRAGTIQDADFLPDATYVLADGSTVRSARFLIRSLTIGRQRITDVPASIGSLASTPLLGQSCLKRLGAWSVDNQREVLIVPALASSRGATRPTLVVSPVRLSSQVAQVGQRLTIELEAINTSKRPGHGMVMVNYAEHLVSFLALHTAGQKTVVQLPASTREAPGQAEPARTAYQLVWSHWPIWAPGERRTAIISLVPRLPQDLTLHVSVVFDDTAVPAASQRWSTAVRIPFRTVSLGDRASIHDTPPRQSVGERLYEQLITTTAHGYGLDPALVKAVIKCGSDFDPWAQSPQDAQGLMQLTPRIQHQWGVSNPFNPQHNVEAGTRYLALLKQEWGGNLQDMLVVYAVVASGYTASAIPTTQQFVRCVFAAYEHYRATTMRE